MTARYIYAGSRRIAVIDATDAVYYYLNDHLGSAGVLIASDGTVRDTYKYKPFGDVGTGQSVNVGQAYRYTGKPLDEEMDLDWYYYGARYYNPEIGRFLAADPLAVKYPDWNPYGYCLSNPLRLFDPDGMEPWDPFGSVYEAAYDFANYYNAESIEVDREYFSFIYAKEVDGTTTYYYESATVGEPISVSPVSHDNTGNRIVSGVHSHAADKYNPFLDESSFSWQDRGAAIEHRLESLYLVTPGGELKILDPNTGQTATLDSNLPSDPYAGFTGTFVQIRDWVNGANARETGEASTLTYNEVERGASAKGASKKSPKTTKSVTHLKVGGFLDK